MSGAGIYFRANDTENKLLEVSSSSRSTGEHSARLSDVSPSPRQLPASIGIYFKLMSLLIVSLNRTLMFFIINRLMTAHICHFK